MVPQITLLVVLMPLMAWGALSSRALNELYALQAEIRETNEAIHAGPAPDGCVPAAPPDVRLEKKTKFRQLDTRRKFKLPAGTRLTLLAHQSRGFVLLNGNDTLRVESPRKLTTPWARQLLSWRRDSLECRLSASRALNGWRLERDLSDRELAETDTIERLYRRPGTHQKLEPIQVIHGSVLPDWQDSLFCQRFSVPDSLQFSSEPWGPGSLPALGTDGLPAVLQFDGLQDDWLAFHRLDTGARLFCHRERAARRFPPEQAADLQRWSALDAERSLAARRYRLLQRWEAPLVEQILAGLVWKGMNVEMLDEALGLPSREIVQGSTVIREYARGNQVILVDGRVTQVEQAGHP